MRFYSIGVIALMANARVVLAMPKDLDVADESSIRTAASSIARGVMEMYTGNVTNTLETIAVWPKPVYWWESGGAWGSMLDYSHYTGDKSYDDVITQAIVSQVGPKYDLMVPLHQGDEGNDDQAFWAFTILEAAERNWLQPDGKIPPWLTVVENAWNTMVSRWDTSTCGGGIQWQIFESNPNGLGYKNSVSNGGLFQISARLARATGNQTYSDWAEKIWDWTVRVGFINSEFTVLDGAGTADGANCKDISGVSFSYSQGIYMYGAAVMYNHTCKAEWANRAEKLLIASNSTVNTYFGPFANSTNVMFEHACESTAKGCNTDQLSFKAWMSRFMWATTQMMPSKLGHVRSLLEVSAKAAANTCTGGASGHMCGAKWWVGENDGNTGLGQQLSALETVVGLLAHNAAPPLKAGEIQHVGGNEVINIFNLANRIICPKLECISGIYDKSRRSNDCI